MKVTSKLAAVLVLGVATIAGPALAQTSGEMQRQAPRGNVGMSSRHVSGQAAKAGASSTQRRHARAHHRQSKTSTTGMGGRSSTQTPRQQQPQQPQQPQQ
jgi:hypothetical protein